MMAWEDNRPNTGNIFIIECLTDCQGSVIFHHLFHSWYPRVKMVADFILF